MGLLIARWRRAPGYEPADLVVSNAGNNQQLDFRELTAAAVRGLLARRLLQRLPRRARGGAPAFLPLGRGTIIFTGASASIRGKPGFAHFSAAKAGLRMISQSMAREYGPLGIHVAHVVVDGGIDGDHLAAEEPRQ